MKRKISISFGSKSICLNVSAHKKEAMRTVPIPYVTEQMCSKNRKLKPNFLPRFKKGSSAHLHFLSFSNSGQC